jgi:16S rRNA (cytidine1402-2'-O)-methyltransferase
MNKDVKVYFVSTPIGNINDITLRALETLKAVDCIFAEDTRITQKLLNYYNIRKPLYIYNKDNEKVSSKKILSFISENKILALTTDAGTPCISDPGSLLVKELIKANISFEVIPGATAFIPALIYSGFDLSSFYFKGFLHHKKNERLKELEFLTQIKSTIVIYESCHRIKKALIELFDFFDPPFFISRELTKIYEEHFYINKKEEVDTIVEKGEFVIILENKKEINNESLNYSKIANELININFTKKDIFKILKVLGCKRNISYKIIEDSKL